MPVTETIKITNSSRLDVALSERTGKTRSAIKQLIEKGNVLVNGNPPKKSGEAVKAGDEITITVPDVVEKIEKKDIPIDILYEDADVAVINKPQGLTVHPAGGNRTDTLVNALMFRLDSLSGINGEIRPGIVHRLDKDTSGVMIVAKNDEAHLSLSRQIADRTVVKEYVAILEGNLTPDEGRIETKIGRKTVSRCFVFLPAERIRSAFTQNISVTPLWAIKRTDSKSRSLRSTDNCCTRTGLPSRIRKAANALRSRHRFPRTS